MYWFVVGRGFFIPRVDDRFDCMLVSGELGKKKLRSQAKKDLKELDCGIGKMGE